MLEAMQILEQDQMLEVMQEAILDVNQILEVASMQKKILHRLNIFFYGFIRANYRR